MTLRLSRPALLFVIAMGGPCVLLVGLTLRMLAQERELAEKRGADDRRRIATDMRQELLGRVARLRLDVLRNHAAGAFGADPASPLAFAGRMEHESLVLPWDDVQAVDQAGETTAFLLAIRAGEAHEFTERQFAAATASYARAARFA